MIVTSPEFEQFQSIPDRFTCQGQNISVPLHFLEIPENVQSYAIIVDDPDAPSGVFTHWLAWNIPATTVALNEGDKVPRQGKNSFGVIGYKGPCPPPGKPHRYFFKVYALDTVLNLPEGSSKEELETAMESHIIGQAEIVGLYKR